MTMWNFVLLLIALLLWAISIFLVAEAAKNQKWAFGGTGGMPEPYSGVAMSQLLSCLFIFLWAARVFLLTEPAQDPIRFLSQLLIKPEQLTPGILLAVFPPVIVGLVKLVTALVVSSEEMENEVERRNRLWITWVYILLHLIIAVAAAMLLARSTNLW
jgi:hypothetical protein